MIDRKKESSFRNFEVRLYLVRGLSIFFYLLHLQNGYIKVHAFLPNITRVVHAHSAACDPPPPYWSLFILSPRPFQFFYSLEKGEEEGGGGGGGKVAASPRIPGACSINFSRFLMFSLYGCSAAGGLRIRLEGLYKADCYPPFSSFLPCSWFAKTCCCARSDSERRLNIFLRRGGTSFIGFL